MSELQSDWTGFRRLCFQGEPERPNGKLRQDQVSRGSRATVGGQAEECPVWRSKQTQLDIELPHSALDKLEEFAEPQCAHPVKWKTYRFCRFRRPGLLPSMGSQNVGHHSAIEQQ